MGSFPFARRYLGNRCFFLFLALLRCFSSGGSPCIPMDSACSDGGSLRRVAPFRYPRITGYLLLTVAFRSLSRLSSALSAKASTLCSLSLDLKCAGSHTPAFGVASPTGRFLSFALSPMKLKSFSLYFRCLFHPLGLPGFLLDFASLHLARIPLI